MSSCSNNCAVTSFFTAVASACAGTLSAAALILPLALLATALLRRISADGVCSICSNRSSTRTLSVRAVVRCLLFAMEDERGLEILVEMLVAEVLRVVEGRWRATRLRWVAERVEAGFAVCVREVVIVRGVRREERW
ncbi:uncharacterized protein V1518DRAFT_422841 [Limtongia smithiae]|uniref:uncharacterized protein n=1 Tax=Limtongia smithiae TaxID=1125753 RepID=UPI0034CD4469